MEKEVQSYLKHHTVFVASLVLFAFVILFIGQIYLFRKTMQLNEMLAEGLMQIKESTKNSQTVDTMPSETPSPSVKPGRMVY